MVGLDQADLLGTGEEIGVMLAVTIWYLVSARRTFKGPIRTIDLPDVGGGIAPAASVPSMAAAMRARLQIVVGSGSAAAPCSRDTASPNRSRRVLRSR